jgi:2-methylaconitate cis-trans-isomerase PrpF
MVSVISLTYMPNVILTVITPSTSVNITNVSSPTKMNGDYLLAQKDIHKSLVIAHSENLTCLAQVNGLVTILNGLLPPIWIG